MTATELRGIRGELNRKEFAALLGWKAGTLANYENGNPIPEDRAAHVRLFVKYQDALKLLKEAEGVIGQHHESSLTTWRGNCPVCEKTGSVYEQNNIFYRIEDVLKESELCTKEKRY